MNAVIDEEIDKKTWKEVPPPLLLNVKGVS